MGGYTDSFTNGGQDFLAYKLAPDGRKQWRKHYGGMKDDRGHAIVQPSQGGYTLAGWTESFIHGTYGFDALVYRLDADGRKLWRKNYGHDNQEDYAYDMAIVDH